MKHTKKRALFTAIAMLVVSAVVLSSATYAWFAAGDTATISGMSATVSPTSGLVISPNNTTVWKASLVKSDFTPAIDTNWFADNLSPVSTITGSGMPFYSGAFEPNTSDVKCVSSTGQSDLGLKIIKFTFWIKSDATKTVYMSDSTITGLANPATYVAMQIGDNGTNNAASKAPVIFSNATDAYYPVKQAGTATDTNGDFVLSDTEAPAMVDATAINSTAITGNTTTFSLTADIPTQIIVYMWLEGNDTNCKLGGVSGEAALSLAFTTVAPTP